MSNLEKQKIENLYNKKDIQNIIFDFLKQNKLKIKNKLSVNDYKQITYIYLHKYVGKLISNNSFLTDIIRSFINELLINKSNNLNVIINNVYQKYLKKFIQNKNMKALNDNKIDKIAKDIFNNYFIHHKSGKNYVKYNIQNKIGSNINKELFINILNDLSKKQIQLPMLKLNKKYLSKKIIYYYCSFYSFDINKKTLKFVDYSEAILEAFKATLEYINNYKITDNLINIIKINYKFNLLIIDYLKK